MLLDHAGVGMPHLLGDHSERHTPHGKPARVGTQGVKVHGPIDPRRRASGAERPPLL